MSGNPHRLSADWTGRLVDRSRKISFTFDDKRFTAHPGDTLASALLANGVRLVGRSFKYHRPRGLVGIGSDEPNALVTIGVGDKLEPNLRATQVEVYDGLVASSQNRWPSLETDVGAMNSALSRFFPAGFYYKTFMWPQAFWKHVYEPVIRKAAGLGPATTEADPDRYEHAHIHCDVLVVGGGIAGLAAAKAVSETGARVVLAEETHRLGGSCDIGVGKIADDAPLEWARGVADDLLASDRVTVMPRTTVISHFDHNYVLMAERVADHNPGLIAAGHPRQRLWKVRANEIIVAAGALERPLTFSDNDRPGIMLASAARGYAKRFGVSPGERVAVFTNNDDAYRTAIQLFEAGVNVPRIVDTRPGPDSSLIDQAKAVGLRMSFGSGIVGVKTVEGGKHIDGIKVAPVRTSGRLGEPEFIPCDAVAMSGGYNPAVHLFCHVGGELVFDDALQSFRPGSTTERLRVVGAANGIFDVQGILEDGFQGGEHAARASLKKRPAKAKLKAPKATQSTEGPLEPIWFVPALGAKNEGNKHFLDFQNDVTAADVELAAREGYRSVEHVKRYTTLGMATDQGKTSNINALGILSDVLDTPIPNVGTTRFRPPYTPTTLGALVGPIRGKLFQPVRRTPIQAWHEVNNAHFEPVGQWRRPYCYLRDGETIKDAVSREVLAVRNSVG
ncbi:MAG: 2Fe-2S iron-sulfur cluster-binding protein, partial [Pseudomonadota bacterium]